MMKNIISFNILLGLFFAISCKNQLKFFETNKEGNIPSNKQLLPLLYKKISKDDFSLKILSKKLLSQSNIQIDKRSFFKNQIRDQQKKETCYNLRLHIIQTTKKWCFLPKNPNFLRTKCQNNKRPRTVKCSKWIRPLYFTQYCSDNFGTRRESQTTQSRKKGFSLKSSLKVKACTSDQGLSFTLKQFKLISETAAQLSQKT
jgi:hypothetical protein